MTDQIRRSPRSVAANLAQAWRKRRDRASFISKRSDAQTEAAQTEAAQTQVWLEVAVRCDYADREAAAAVYKACDGMIATIVTMIAKPDPWLLDRPC